MVNVLGGRSPSPPASAASLPPHQVERLIGRLGETRRWCGARSSTGSVAARLRTAELAPDLEDELALPALEEALEVLAVRRRSALAATPEGEWGEIEGGRLLVCELDMSLGSGEAEAASEGFFDVDDRPPWDLWLVCFGKTRPAQPEEPIACLIAWVPDSLCARAEAGVRSSSSRCLHWVDEIGGTLTDQLAPERWGA
jgi:hypothetical protein